MFNVVSIIIGVVALLFAVIAFAAIWGALGLYVLALIRHARATVTVPD